MSVHEVWHTGDRIEIDFPEHWPKQVTEVVDFTIQDGRVLLYAWVKGHEGEDDPQEFWADDVARVA